MTTASIESLDPEPLEPNPNERRMRALREVASSTAAAKTADEVFALAADTLARFDLDLPFVLMYALEPGGMTARLRGSTGLTPGGIPAPTVLSLVEDGGGAWPLGEVVCARRAMVIDDLDTRFGALRCGPYPEPPRLAIALPISLPGSERPTAVLVAGVSSRLALSDAYRGFYDLLAGVMTTALANARAHEDERHRAEASCVPTNLDIQALLMQAPTPVCVLRGRDYVIELANPEVCQLWGRTRDELVDRPLLDALPELRGQGFAELLDVVMTTGVPHTGLEVVAALDRSRTGQLESLFLNFAYTPLHDVGGERDGVLVIASDVTDAVRAREEMAHLRDLAESANRSKDEFLAMLGHELRNPLAPLQTALQLIRSRLGPSAVDRQLDVIDRQTKNLSRIVDDLLEVSRITHGKIELVKQRVDLGKAISLALEATRELVESRKHDVSVSLPFRPVFVLADPVRLDQIVVNLVNNAAKYTDIGGRIWVSLEHQGQVAELRVRDNGIGIPEQLRARVFDVFQQGAHDLSRAHGGLGIGLSIVRRLVELHGGEVDVRSEGAGRGSEFIVRLPLALEDSAAAAPTEAIEPAPAGRHGTLRILVVDDNEDAAECLVALIEELGHETRTAADGPTALRLTESWTPDLVFLDIGLPGMDGYEVARRLRCLHEDVPRLVALTGYGQESDRVRAHEAGFDQHMVKPPRFEAIAAVIDDVDGAASRGLH